MTQPRAQVLEESRKRGMIAGACAAATVTLGVVAGGPIVAVAALPTAIFGWRWWKHRAQNGIRF